MIAAILALNIADHFFAPCFAEIDIEIGHRHTFGIEEPFEQQPEFDRIKVGNR